MDEIVMFHTRNVENLKPGINIYGYAFAEHGIGEVVRLNAQIVRQAGIDFSVIPYLDTGSRQEAKFNVMGTGESIYDINLITINADTVPKFVRHFGRAILQGRHNIGMWAWEIEDMPDWMTHSAQYFDELWAISEFTAKAIEKSVSCQVFPLPCPVSIARPRDRSREDLGLTEDYLFLFCYDFNSIFERKNPLAIIEAFKQAFTREDSVRLLIKTINGFHFQSQLEHLEAVALDHPKIDVVDGYLEFDDQLALMHTCDSYISLHRAEGFGFTLAEAMALGKPVIATGYSGNMDFMNEYNSYLVPYRMVDIPEGCDPYPTTSRWAEPDTAAAASLMRRVLERQDEARRKAKQAQIDIERRHTIQARAGFMIERWAKIRKKIEKPKAREIRTESYTVVRYVDEEGENESATRNTPSENKDRSAVNSHRAFASIKDLLQSRLVKFAHDKVVPDLVCGRIDGAAPDPDGGVGVWGWAYDPRTNGSAPAVVLLLNKRQIPAQIPVDKERQDVAAYLGIELTAAGWGHRVTASRLSKWGTVFEAYAVLEDGRFGRLESKVVFEATS